MADDMPDKHSEDLTEGEVESMCEELADDDVANVVAGEAGTDSLVPLPPLPPLPPFPG